ncbi:MAG: FAD-dependent oxidoreductase, partial [Pseudomonadota bacterium]
SARHAVDSGVLDMAGMVRAHIADPEIANKLAAGEEDRIRPCVGAGYCLDRIYLGGTTHCIHNAATGREATMPHVIEPSDGPKKKVVIVGGGPGGLEAARVAASRGHRVVLFEASGALGGQVLLAARAGWRKDLIGIVDWLAAEVARLGVEIRWDTMAEEADVLAENPDVVVIATGGLPDTDFVPGGAECLSTWDVLSGRELSGSVLVYDDCGQPQGPSCADFLSGRPGVTVEMITPDRAAAVDMGTMNYPIFMEHFYKNGVTVTPDHRLASVAREGNRLRARFTNEFGGPEIDRIVDHVVVEHGTLPLNEVFEGLREASANNGVIDFERLSADQPQEQSGEGFQLFCIGDAVSSRNIHAAIYDALRLCKDL